MSIITESSANQPNSGVNNGHENAGKNGVEMNEHMNVHMDSFNSADYPSKLCKLKYSVGIAIYNSEHNILLFHFI